MESAVAGEDNYEIADGTLQHPGDALSEVNDGCLTSLGELGSCPWIEWFLNFLPGGRGGDLI